MKSASVRLSVIAVLLAFPFAAAHASEQKLSFSPENTHIDWLLGATGHDVEGSFELISGEITFDDATGAASGHVEIDATSARTGNDSRDDTMHEDVLETTKYPRFTFRPTKVDGSVSERGKSSIKLHGILNIHGQDHAVVLPAEVSTNGDQMSISTSFRIPFVEWGMKDPSILFLRVEKEVQVKLSATATVSTPEASPATGSRQPQ